MSIPHPDSVGKVRKILLFWTVFHASASDCTKLTLEDEVVLLGQLTYSQWRTVLMNDARGKLLEVARSGDWQLVVAFLVEIGSNHGPDPP